MGKVYRKGRSYTGDPAERYSPSALFTKEQVFAILDDCFSQEFTNFAKIGRKYGVTGVAIRYIADGKSYHDWVVEWNAQVDKETDDA